MHSAKGLQYDAVFSIRAADSVIPGRAHGLEEIEEERRLLYVAMTRARDALTTSCAKLYGLSRWTRPTSMTLLLSVNGSPPEERFEDYEWMVRDQSVRRTYGMLNREPAGRSHRNSCRVCSARSRSPPTGVLTVSTIKPTFGSAGLLRVSSKDFADFKPRMTRPACRPSNSQRQVGRDKCRNHVAHGAAATQPDECIRLGFVFAGT
jgi:hypothetical protein